MSLREQIDQALKIFMKERAPLKLSTIRLVLAAIRNEEIDQKKELDDSGVMEILNTLVKQRRESIRLFQEAGRIDLVAKEEQELALMLGFMPPQLDRSELVALVTAEINACKMLGRVDMGSVMKQVMPKVAGRTEGKVVSVVVKELLDAVNVG